MQDRPDLIESELSGLAFDSNQQIFKTTHIEIMFNQPPPPSILNEAVYTFIDPAAGGPQSDYAILSVTRHKGLLTVSKTSARALTHQVRLPNLVHEGLPRHPGVLDPPWDQLVAQRVVETLGLERAERAHQQHPRLPRLLHIAQIAPHGLILVQQHDELDLQRVQRVPLARPEQLQGLGHARARPVLAPHVDHRLLNQPPDESRVRPEQHV